MLLGAELLGTTVYGVYIIGELSATSDLEKKSIRGSGYNSPYSHILFSYLASNQNTTFVGRELKTTGSTLLFNFFTRSLPRWRYGLKQTRLNAAASRHDLSHKLVFLVGINSYSFPGRAIYPTYLVSILAGRTVQCGMRSFLFFWRGPLGRGALTWLASLLA